MLVTKDQLAAYEIPETHYFARRVGNGDPISRDAYFINNTSELVLGVYCAIGSDEFGWQLEQYNGANWVEVNPNEEYSLIITNAGLAAMTDIIQGGYKLTISGVKIIDALITEPTTPIINWTDTEFQQAGNVVFTCGTQNSPHSATELSNILSWRFLNASGGLQYILDLPTEGLGSIADNGAEDWSIGAIGLYVKSNLNGASDILFAIGCLPSLIQKYSTTVSRIGNSVKIYLNTVLNNLGLVSNLEVIQEEECSIPEVPNETLLLYPSNPLKRPHNCYVVDSLFGTGIPALAVPRVTTSTNPYDPDWAYFQPSDNTITVGNENFDSDVKNYMFVYWDTTTQTYKLAEGSNGNEKQPMGLRIGNTIVFSGTIINAATNYTYSLNIADKGQGYSRNDELIAEVNNLGFKVKVQEIDDQGGITELDTTKTLTNGNIELNPNPQTVPLTYDPRYSVLNPGSGASVIITATEQDSYTWNFDSSWYNKPVYCGNGNQAGKLTLEETDAFVGWCLNANTIRLALDLRTEASDTNYGATRYASVNEVKTSNVNAYTQTAITPKALQNNYLKITKTNKNYSEVNTTSGNTYDDPVIIDTFCQFKETIIGKGCTPANYNGLNPTLKNELSFYGNAYHAYWADLAEFYEADKIYEPGTLITFGKGEKEISVATLECNGIISSKPGYILGNCASERHLPVALCGRVPVLFDSSCIPTFGAKVYLSSVTPGRASTIPNGKCIGKIIEKNFGSKKLLECVVRIDF